MLIGPSLVVVLSVPAQWQLMVAGDVGSIVFLMHHEVKLMLKTHTHCSLVHMNAL